MRDLPRDRAFEAWWDTQWIRFDNDDGLTASRKSIARDSWDAALNWFSDDRLAKELVSDKLRLS